ILRVVMFFTKRRGYRTIAGVSMLFAEKTIVGRRMVSYAEIDRIALTCSSVAMTSVRLMNSLGIEPW
ncbi:MAG: hypothetical protein KAU31_02930, partial [Spirochaetaceae bacterium]|nr:hypothetical protein [Spirochaetaceae bacterium]